MDETVGVETTETTTETTTELLEFLPECGATQHDFELIPNDPRGGPSHIFCRQCGTVRALFP